MFLEKQDAGEGHINIDINSFTATAGTWALSGSSAYYSYATVSNPTAGNGDKITFKVFLAEGTYKIYALHAKSAGAGILQFALDATDIYQIDEYNATTQNNVTSSSSAFAVTRAGIYTFSARVNGKNASSAGYGVTLHQISLVRTA